MSSEHAGTGRGSSVRASVGVGAPRASRAGRVLGARDVGAEAILLAGGARAILLQLAHPLVARGVAEHSDFASRPLDRLHGTLTFTYAVVFGSPAEVAEVRRRVNRAHGPVHSARPGVAPGEVGSGGIAPGGVAPGAAAPGGAASHYSAFDPELQLWVAATLYATSVEIWERVFGSLHAASADRVYREYAALATELQVPPDLWPPDRDAFARYWARMLTELTPTPQAAAVARSLLFPGTAAPRWMHAFLPLIRLITAGTLDERMRSAYGMRWNTALQRRFDRWMLTLTLLYRPLPLRVRHIPRDFYLRRLRRSLADA